MHNRIALGVVFLAGFVAGSLVLLVHSQEAKTKPPAKETAPPDAVAEAQTPREVADERPEQKKTAHDLSDIFAPGKALPSSEALVNQTDQGQMLGFDFYRDPLGAMKPGMTFELGSEAPRLGTLTPEWRPRKRKPLRASETPPRASGPERKKRLQRVKGH